MASFGKTVLSHQSGRVRCADHSPSVKRISCSVKRGAARDEGTQERRYEGAEATRERGIKGPRPVDSLGSGSYRTQIALFRNLAFCGVTPGWPPLGHGDARIRQGIPSPRTARRPYTYITRRVIGERGRRERSGEESRDRRNKGSRGLRIADFGLRIPGGADRRRR